MASRRVAGSETMWRRRALAMDARPGDFVTVTVRPEQGGSEALEIMVVDTGAP